MLKVITWFSTGLMLPWNPVFHQIIMHLLTVSYVLPRLLNDITWPKEPTHICCGVVILGKRHQLAVNWVWWHDNEGNTPSSSNHFQGMRFCLPDPGLQRFANGTVSLQRYCNKVECRYTYRDTYIYERKKKVIPMFKRFILFSNSLANFLYVYKN